MMAIDIPKQVTRRWRGRGFAALQWLLIIATLLLLGGCSTTQWFYRNADWFLERYAVKSVDVNEAQLKAWRPGLESVLQQHLDREIPILDRYLELVAQFVDGSPGERLDATCLVRGANLIFTRHAELAADLAAPLLVQLAPRQIEHLAGYMAERRTRFVKRYLTGDEGERQQARTVRLTERIEAWTGPLDSRQQARVKRLTAHLPDITARWLEHRKLQEDWLLQLLREHADVDALHAHLLHWWVPWVGEAPGFADQWKMAEAAFIHLLDDLSVSLTHRQRQHFIGRVLSFRNDLAALSGDAPHAVRETPRQLQCYEKQL